MAEIRICGIPEVPSFIEKFQIKKLLSCLSKYELFDSVYGFTASVMNLDPVYWGKPENWMKLNMEDTPNPAGEDAPNIEEVVKGITFGSNSIKAGQNLLVHCQLGLSRSPAMAIGSMIMAGDTIEGAFNRALQVRPRIDPNTLIIKLIDGYLNLGGELIKYNDQHRARNRAGLQLEYRNMMESHLDNPTVLGVIFENISALDRL